MNLLAESDLGIAKREKRPYHLNELAVFLAKKERRHVSLCARRTSRRDRWIPIVREEVIELPDGWRTLFSGLGFEFVRLHLPCLKVRRKVNGSWKCCGITVWSRSSCPVSLSLSLSLPYSLLFKKRSNETRQPRGASKGKSAVGFHSIIILSEINISTSRRRPRLITGTADPLQITTLAL